MRGELLSMSRDSEDKDVVNERTHLQSLSRFPMSNVTHAGG
jgi:hypothetical protein